MDDVKIDVSLVRRLVASQFPEWKDLPIAPVVPSGWDNRTFHLGKKMLVRLPSASDYALQIEKEQKWLPKLAPFLPLAIPVPLAIGKPEWSYPWRWSIYCWLEGEAAAHSSIANLDEFAASLARFLTALQKVDPMDGPMPGLHSFYRGGSLVVYDQEVRQSIAILADKVDPVAVTKIWEMALQTAWNKPLVWVHGDISLGNLLLKSGQLCAVIDFGQLTLGDPACDLAIYWTLFHGHSRAIFREVLALDQGTWLRARAWALWKALIVAAGSAQSNNVEAANCWRIIDGIIADYRSNPF